MKTKETKIAVELFITAVPNHFSDSEEPFEYKVNTFDLTGLDSYQDHILVHSEEVSVTLPAGISLVDKAVESLEESKSKLQAEYYVRKTAIEEKIANLKALEYKPEVEDDMPF